MEEVLKSSVEKRGVLMFQQFLRPAVSVISCRIMRVIGIVRLTFIKLLGVRMQADAGMSTAEYAIGTIAACAFAALLYKVITSTQILDLLTGVVTRALQVPF
jgi:hypothetical protein